METIKNAVITSAKITNDDHGLLTAWLMLDYGGSGQGFGGHVLYLPKDFKYHKVNTGYAGHFIWRVMEVAEVSEWSQLKGKTIRVKLDNPGIGGKIISIGHIIKDNFFDPSKEFEKD